VYVCGCVLRVVSAVGGHELIAPNPPFFLFGWFLNEEPGGRVPSLKKNPSFPPKLGLFFREGPHPPGSSFGNHPKRKPQGGVVSFDQSGVLILKIMRGMCAHTTNARAHKLPRCDWVACCVSVWCVGYGWVWGGGV